MARIRKFLDDYVIDQKSSGRFPRPLNNHLYNIDGWLQAQQAWSATTTRRCCIMAFAFLAVCLVNTVGLLLAKFLNAAPIAGVRRALGRQPPRHLLAAPHRIRRGGAWPAASPADCWASAGVWALRAWYGRFVQDLERSLPDRLQHVRDRRGHLARRRNRSPACIPAWRIGRAAPASYLKVQ